MKECKYKDYHHVGEDDCLDCNHVDSGGNWKKILCWFIRHDWNYVYSWSGYCQRCLRDRSRKDY